MRAHPVYGVAALIAALFISACLAQDEVPPVDEFLRRANGRVVRLGDRLFYDGGEVSQRGFNAERYSNPANATLSIDLSRSWAPKDVEIAAIPHPEDTIQTIYPCIFVDEQKSAFYSWGGRPSWWGSWILQRLRRFDLTGSTRESWSEVPAQNEDDFPEGYFGWQATCASTPGAGFLIGGYDPESPEPVLRYFNFTTQIWELQSEAPVFFWDASAVFVPNFGSHGLVFVLAGTRQAAGDRASYVDFETVYFFDPGTKDWYTQNTTGVIPLGRLEPCIVGVGGTNGSFDIFMYGGESVDQDKLLGEVYVLSLPGFVWTKVHDDASSERAYHTCALVGNRQLLSWGGLQGRDWSNPFRWDTADHFPQGIGIFDMSELAWKGEYDAEAGTYRAHETIASFYEQGGMDTVEWSSPEVSSLFVVVDEEPTSIPPSDQGLPPSDQGPLPTPRGSSTPVGAIAGGVVGGVMAVALVAAAVWFFLLKGRRRTTEVPVEADGRPVVQDFQPSGFHSASELQGKPLPAELAEGNAAPQKPPRHSTISELDATGAGKQG